MLDQWIQQKVIKAGYKRTSVREKVFSYIERHDGLFCATHIIEFLAPIDKVSVYRTIELLVSLDIIHPVVQLNGQQFYEIHQEATHHHHIVCTECLGSECVSCDVPKKQITGFSDIHHSLTMTGVCASCIV